MSTTTSIPAGASPAAPAAAAPVARARSGGPLGAAVAIFKRELSGYFSTPVAYVFIVIFLFLTAVFTFNLGGFFERGQADLRPFFLYHPWLYLFLIPAVSMRLWAEERRSGTMELLMTLPVPLWSAVVGKFLAAWGFIGIALLLTFPLWITVNYLGSPDNGTIAAGYAGSFLMAGGFLAIGSWVSAMTKSQVIAFVISVVVCFGFLVSGLPMVLDAVRQLATSQTLLDAVAGFSFLTRFDAISRGVIDLRDVVYFVSLIGLFLLATGVAIEVKKA